MKRQIIFTAIGLMLAAFVYKVKLEQDAIRQARTEAVIEMLNQKKRDLELGTEMIKEQTERMNRLADDIRRW